MGLMPRKTNRSNCCFYFPSSAQQWLGVVSNERYPVTVVGGKARFSLDEHAPAREID